MHQSCVDLGTPGYDTTYGWGFVNAYNAVLLAKAYDSVGDGISDWWRRQYFGGTGATTNRQSCAACDPDGDGFSNLQEFLAGTDPTSGASSLRITSLVETGLDVFVTWTMGSGRTNALQATAGDASGNYSNNFTDIFTVTNTVGTVTNYLDAGGATNSPSRFYRVRLVP